MKYLAFLCCLITQNLTAQNITKTTLAAGLTTIESAAPTGFKQFYTSDANATTLQVDNIPAVINLRQLVITYGPFTTEAERNAKSLAIKNEIIKQRKNYYTKTKTNLLNNGVIWIGKNISDGYNDPHIFIINDKRKEKFYVDLKFEATDELAVNYYIKNVAERKSAFSRSFNKVFTNANTLFAGMLGQNIPNESSYNKDTLYKALHIIEGTTNNIIVKDEMLGGTIYQADIAADLPRDRAIILLDAWRIKISEALGNAYYYNEKTENYQGTIKRREVNFKLVKEVKSPGKDVSVNLTIVREYSGDKFTLTMEVSVYDSWNF